MEHPEYQFIDRTGLAAEPLHLIAPVVIPKEAIEAEVERLASLPVPADGRRVSMIVNPHTSIGNNWAAARYRSFRSPCSNRASRPGPSGITLPW